MAEVKKDSKPEANKDVWTSDKTNWEYISIPEENALGFKHDSISNNKHVFEAGKTYLVPPEVAVDVRDRLKVYARAVVRTLQPGRDLKAERAVSVGSANSGGTPVDPSLIG